MTKQNAESLMDFFNQNDSTDSVKLENGETWTPAKLLNIINAGGK